MNTISVVERHFDPPAGVEEIFEGERRVADYLRERHMTWLSTFASRDRRHLVSFYDAPDAEGVRDTLDRAGVAHDRVWSGGAVRPTQRPVRPEGYSTVVVQRETPHGMPEEAWKERVESSQWCLSAHRVVHVESVFSAVSALAVCVFFAPDSEAVRLANERLGSSDLRAWPCDEWHAR